MKHLLGLGLWDLCIYAELTKVIDLLNKVQIGNIDDNVEKLNKARFMHESDQNYPKDALHMFAENETAMKSN